MKYLVLTTLLAVTATPRLETADPYKKYDLVLDHAKQNIELTKASINEAKKMTESKVQEVQETISEAKEMAKKVELLEMVCEVYEIQVPKTMEDFKEEQRADSIRVANMQKLNEKSY